MSITCYTSFPDDLADKLCRYLIAHPGAKPKDLIHRAVWLYFAHPELHESIPARPGKSDTPEKTIRGNKTHRSRSAPSVGR